MKAILEFDLDNPDDEVRYAHAVKADQMWSVLFEISSNLRKRLRWKSEASPDIDEVDLLFEMIMDEFEENGIDEYFINRQ